MIECPKCGHDNDLGRIFCAKCGEKLEISKVGIPSSIKRQARKGRKAVPFSKRAAAFFEKSIKVVMLAATSALLVSIWLPPRYSRKGFNEKDLESFRQKHAQLEEAVAGHSEVTLTVEEPEVNAFLAEAVRSTAADSAKAGGLSLESMCLSLDKDDALLTVISKWKWFRLSVQARARPAQEGGAWKFSVAEIRIGRLMVPSPLQARLVPTFQKLLGGFNVEQQWIEQLASFEIKEGRAVLTTKKGG